jgi:hypothetical protein
MSLLYKHGVLMRNQILAMLGIVGTIGIISFPAVVSAATTAPPVPVPSKLCLKTETLITWHLPINPNSYNDFTYTAPAWRCVPNTLINSTAGVPPSPTVGPYAKATMAMKMLVNPSIMTPAWLTGSFKPMTITGVGTCSAFQQSVGQYGSILGTASLPKFKLCGTRSSGGIGDDARSRVAAQKTLKIYYPTAVLTNIQLLNNSGNPI